MYLLHNQQNMLSVQVFQAEYDSKHLIWAKMDKWRILELRR